MGIEDIKKKSPAEEAASLDGVITETLLNLHVGSTGEDGSHKPWPADEVKKIIDRLIELLTKSKSLYAETGDSESAAKYTAILNQLKRIDPSKENTAAYIGHLFKNSELPHFKTSLKY